MSSAFAGEVTEESVDQAVRQAVDWLKTQRQAAGHYERASENRRFYTGDTGLSLLTLLYAGENPNGPEMSTSLDWLANQQLHETYTIGTRAHVFSLVPGRKYRETLEGDLDWLTKNIHKKNSENPGAYHYEADGSGYDNSNSQYGVLGVWMATDAGFTIESNYWQLVAEHWLRDQGDDGGWGYKEDDKTVGSMTSAGLATLYVVLDRYYVTKPREAIEIHHAIDKGIKWLGDNFSTENPNGGSEWKYYYLYSVERIGRASGQKYFQDVDWFRTIAAHLLDTQEADGKWPGKSSSGEFDMSHLRNTCFATMFLCHGRAPLVFNKLQYEPVDLRGKPRPTGPPPPVDEEGKTKSEIRKLKRERDKLIEQMEEEQERRDDWNLNTRDIAGLTRFSQASMERLLNWQIVRLDGRLDDLMEAPVLYMTGRKKWEFTDSEVKKLREYCDRGGLLLGVVGNRDEGFEDGFRDLIERAFPQYTLEELPADHPLFTNEIRTEIRKPPKMYQISNGLRVLALLCTDDIGRAWHRYKTKGKDSDLFELGLNLFLYATDKTTPKSRLQTPNIPVKQVEIAREATIVRIKYDGKWDPEPYGWERLKIYMNNETRTRLKIVNGISFDSKELRQYPVAHITGTSAFEFSSDEIKGLKRYLARGGTLIADSAAGSREFTECLEKHIQEVLSGEPLLMGDRSPIISGRGIPGATSLERVFYKRDARRQSKGKETPRLQAYDLAGRAAVIFSPLDLSAGMLGTSIYNCRGYEGESCQRIMRNLVMYGQLPPLKKAELSK